MSFDAIRDQEIPVRMLRNMLVRKRVPHGLLFWGPGGVGKGMTARAFAKAVHCTEREDDGCDQCLACRKVDHGNHPDLTLVQPVKKSRIIDVEAIEGINELAMLKPFESKWRVFVIVDADRMGAAAQNHFLKTLEEPPGNAVFVMTTEHPQVLLPTIRSRCQRVRFRGLRPETIAHLLQKQRELEHETAQAIAAISQGQMSRALDLVDSQKREVVLDVVQRLTDGEDPLALAEAFAQHLNAQRKVIEGRLKGDGDDNEAVMELSPGDRDRMKEERQALADAMTRRETLEYLYLFESWYRDRLVFEEVNDESRVFNRDHVFQLEATPARGDLEEKVRAIEQARIYLERFLNEERVFRDLFFTLAG